MLVASASRSGDLFETPLANAVTMSNSAQAGASPSSATGDDVDESMTIGAAAGESPLSAAGDDVTAAATVHPSILTGCRAVAAIFLIFHTSPWTSRFFPSIDSARP